jgi:hypothetical protein
MNPTRILIASSSLLLVALSLAGSASALPPSPDPQFEINRQGLLGAASLCQTEETSSYRQESCTVKQMSDGVCVGYYSWTDKNNADNNKTTCAYKVTT